MKRRLVLLGAGATGLSLLGGTGAYDSFRADRRGQVEVVADENMLLGISPAEEYNGQYVRPTEEGRPVYVIDITAANEAVGNGGGPYALGVDSTIRIEGLLWLTNNTGSDRAVFVEDHEAFPGEMWDVFHGQGAEATSLLGEENDVVIEPGGQRLLGMEIETEPDADVDRYENELRIAVKPGDDR